MLYKNLYSTTINLYKTRQCEKAEQYKSTTDTLLDKVKGFPVIYKKFIICRNLVNDKVLTKDELYYFLNEVGESKSNLYALILEYTVNPKESKSSYRERLSFTSTPEVLFLYFLDVEQVTLIMGSQLKELMRC